MVTYSVMVFCIPLWPQAQLFQVHRSKAEEREWVTENWGKHPFFAQIKYEKTVVLHCFDMHVWILQLKHHVWLKYLACIQF